MAHRFGYHLGPATIHTKVNATNWRLGNNADGNVYLKEWKNKITKVKKSLQPVKPVSYSVIKHGIVGLTKYITTYWSSEKIRCNALSPGPVLNLQSKSLVNNLKKLIPMGRLANKHEYKSAIKFLCTDDSSYMTGQNVIIDGGRSIW